MKRFMVGSRLLGESCFVIAEAGVNHNGDFALACQLVDAAVEAGADAVKFQTFKSEQVVSSIAPKAEYQRDTTGSGESQLDMVRRLELPFDDFAKLKAYCDARSILFLSTPFDDDSVDFLDRLGMPIFKIASGEVTNLPSLSRIGARGKPVILSTGMASLEEVEQALRALRRFADPAICILQCVSNYPADAGDANLRAMDTMATAFGLPVGYSDHTLGIEVALAAVARGAAILEKHFTLDKTMPGPDHRCSLDPTELKALIAGVRRVEASLGSGRKEPAAAEADTARVARRSLFTSRAVTAGSTIEADDLVALRPGDGVSPALTDLVQGRRAKRNLSGGHKLSWEDVE